MTLKKAVIVPEGYCDWTVYPLEGVWDISDKAKQDFDGTLDKDELVFDLMLRQPSFVEESLFEEMLEFTKKKKANPLLDRVQFIRYREGRCVQMMHVGSYDDEPESFDIMEDFAKKNDVLRLSKMHREIYLSDFRKVPKDRLKTVLRFQLKS